MLRDSLAPIGEPRGVALEGSVVWKEEENESIPNLVGSSTHNF